MEYGRGALTKCDYAVTAAAALAYLLLRQQDAVGCVAFDEKIRQMIPLRTNTSHLTTIIRALERANRRDKTNLYDVLARAAETYPRRGMMILISDLLGRPRRLAALRSACCGSAATMCSCSMCWMMMSSIFRSPARPASKVWKRTII